MFTPAAGLILIVICAALVAGGIYLALARMKRLINKE